MVEDQDLTAREAELIELMAQGYSNKEIADRLFLSPHTVKTHLRQAFRKAGVRNRVEAASWWARRDAQTPGGRSPGVVVPATRVPWGRRRWAMAAGVAVAVTGIVAGSLVFTGLGALDGGDHAGSAGAPVCSVMEMAVMAWRAQDEVPLTLPGGTTATYATIEDGRQIVLPGYTVAAVLRRSPDGSAFYECPSNYSLGEAELQAATGR